RDGFVSWELRKPVAIRKPKDIVESGFRSAVRDQVEQAEALNCRGWGVDPGIILSRAVVDGVANAEAELAHSGPAGPAMKPDVAHVGGVVTGRDVSMRRRKDGETAGVQSGGNRPVAHVGGPAIGAGGPVGP